MSDAVYRALDAIRENPKNWDQSTFVGDDCNSAFCLAGHILNQTGEYEIREIDSGFDSWKRIDDPTDEYVPPARTAAEVAGISSTAANALFLSYPLMATRSPDLLAKWTEVVLADETREVDQFHLLAAEFDFEHCDGELVTPEEARISLENLRATYENTANG